MQELKMSYASIFRQNKEIGGLQMNARIRPILFNTDMVQAVLDERKTVTRRIIMPHNRKKAKEQGYRQGSGLWINPDTDNGDEEGHIKDYSISSCWISYSHYIKEYADFKPGDILYVREKWCKNSNMEEYYYATKRKFGSKAPYGLRWRPSIHMPKKIARIWLKVIDVRVERLQEISMDQIRAEGIANPKSNPMMGKRWENMQRMEFEKLWDSTIKKQMLPFWGWRANPWVLVVEFEKCERPEE